MSINIDSIYTALKSWCDTATGLTTIRAEQNGEAPNEPYFTMRIATKTRIGEDYFGSSSNMGVIQIVGNRDLTVEMQGYGNGVTEKMEDLVQSLRKPSVQLTFRQAGIAIVDSEPALNITGLDGTEFEERVSCDFIFRVASVTTDEVSYIDTSVVEGTSLGPDLNTISIDTVTITST